MEAVVVVARLLLAAVFAVAGLAKLFDRAGSIRSMIDFGVPQSIAAPFAVILPILELACAAALIPASTVTWGAIGVLTLLALFIAGISMNLARGRAPDCHCFGQLHSKPVGWGTVARNVGLAALAVLVLRTDAEATSIPSALGRVAAEQSLAAALAWIASAIAALALYLAFQVLRQNGRLLLRLEAIETKLGIMPGLQASGLPVDSPAPPFSLRDLDGGTVKLDQLQVENKPLLLVFSEPGCAACDELLPDVARWQRENKDQLLTVVISRGTVGQNRNKRARLTLQTVLLQTNREVAEAYHVLGTPSAVLIEDGRIARPMAAGADPIRSLVSEATQLRVPKGSPAPSLPMTDLRGESIDVSRATGKRRLLLFWSPTCGYCQQMLDDVKAWERRPPTGAPDLVVISTGSVEANHEQGFRSPVFLDQDFKASEILGIAGTPSALLLDEKGRVASDIAVGKERVLALANRI